MTIPEYGDFCWNCAFYQHRIDPVGECHKSAPTVYFITDRDVSDGGEFEERAACWPTVDETDWCGDYQPMPLSRQRDRDYIENAFEKNFGARVANNRINLRNDINAKVLEFRRNSDERDA